MCAKNMPEVELRSAALFPPPWLLAKLAENSKANELFSKDILVDA